VVVRARFENNATLAIVVVWAMLIRLAVVIVLVVIVLALLVTNWPT
jgi:hypothetical protein